MDGNTSAALRIDKWLWAIRIYKSRSLATEQCNQGRISINGTMVKASRLIKVGNVIQITRSGFARSIEVLKLSDKRLSAKLVPEFMLEHTPQCEIDAYKTRIAKASIFRTPGSGRPTKRERRDLDDFLFELSNGDAT